MTCCQPIKFQQWKNEWQDGRIEHTGFVDGFAYNVFGERVAVLHRTAPLRPSF